jgi:hypothetical protein
MTMAMLAAPFEHGNGPSHGVVEMIWRGADAIEYLPEGGSKLDRVLAGLEGLQGPNGDAEKLRNVVGPLATRLMVHGELDPDKFEAALARDGFELGPGGLSETSPGGDTPDGRLARHVAEMLGGGDRFQVARRHYVLGNDAWERREWESANAQYRSACDAVFDELAHANGCPASKTGGAARKWLQQEGFLAEKEAELVRAFMGYAGDNGSHAGISDAAECQLRRHFATAIITFAVMKLG